MNEPLVYISLTSGKDRLVIDGSFDLFKKFVTTFTQEAAPIHTPIIHNPAPIQAQEITAQGGAHA